MDSFLLLIAAVALGAGLLAFALPAKIWNSLTPARSRWSHQASVGGALLFGGLGLGGAGLLFVSLADLAGGWRSRHWLPVEATVVESRAETVRQIRSTNPAYRPAVTYRYHAAGREHTGRRVAFGALETPDRAAVDAQLANRFAVGSRLTVWVSPQDPTEAVIEPGVQPMAVLLTSLGAVLLGVAGWQLRSLARDWRGERPVPEAPAKSPGPPTP